MVRGRATPDLRSRERSAEDGGEGPPSWLLLTHHLPPEPAYFRVKVSRRLERVGAVALKNSVYALPPGDDTREDFEWLAREIERNGGEASLCTAHFVDDVTDARLVRAFREARDADYEALREEALGLIAAAGADSASDGPSSVRGKAAKLRRKLEEVRAIDFFAAPGGSLAERAVAGLESTAADRVDQVAEDDGNRPLGRTWVTRRGVKEDRIASAWLIRRFIDPAATFRFVRPDGYEPAPGELRFDMYGGEFTHEGDMCTFETLLERFGLGDPSLRAIGEVVHDIDLKDEKFGRGETAGVAALIRGLGARSPGDEERLERGSALFDALYEDFRAP